MVPFEVFHKALQQCLNMCIYIHIRMYIHVYIYIHAWRARELESGSFGRSDGDSQFFVPSFFLQRLFEGSAEGVLSSLAADSRNLKPEIGMNCALCQSFAVL